LAVEAMAEAYESSHPDLAEVKAIKDWLRKAVAKANTAVYEAALDNAEARNMGTTIVAALFSDDGVVHIAHAGDSRAYLVRECKASPITIDHSVVMEMHVRGQLTLQQCKENIYRHLITRCLGHEPEVDVDLNEVKLKADDWIFLASDGLEEGVKQEEDINACFAEEGDVESVCKRLLDRALKGGAPDNVTIVAAQISMRDAAVSQSSNSR
ncbi:MAG TPA: protein phosphatase 2C domain-containing protein, partial [Candidatus Obscuribacterales bacterium]